MNNSCVRNTGLRLIVFLLVSLFLFCSATGIWALADPWVNPATEDSSAPPDSTPEVVIPSASLDSLSGGDLEETPAEPVDSLTIKFQLESLAGVVIPSEDLAPGDLDAEFIVRITKDGQEFYSVAKNGDTVTYALGAGEYTLEYFCATSGYILGDFYDDAGQPLLHEDVSPPIDPTESEVPEGKIPRVVTVETGPGTETIVTAAFTRSGASFRCAFVVAGTISVDDLHVAPSGFGIGADDALGAIEPEDVTASPEPSESPSSTPEPTPSVAPTPTPTPSAPPSSTPSPTPSAPPSSTPEPTPSAPASTPPATQTPDTEPSDESTPTPDAPTPTPDAGTPEPETPAPGGTDEELEAE